MKKPILTLLFFSCLVFFGLNKANALASKITLGYVNPPSTPNTITYGSTVVLAGMSAVTNSYTTGTATTTVINYTTNNFGSGQNLTNYFALANVQLWYTNSNTLTGGTQIAGASIAGSSVTFTGTTLTFSGFSQPQAAGQTFYYYVVATYNVNNATTNFEIDESGITTTASTYTGIGYGGGPYTLAAAPVTATAASLTTTVGSNGLTATNPINSPANYAVYGMSLTPSASGTTKALTGLTFTTSGTPAQTDNYFYATAYLYSSNNSSYDGTAVQISTVTPVPASNTLAFTGFSTAQSITAGTTKYYYVVIVYSTGVAATATQTITYSSATATATVTAGATVAGPSYTYSPIPYATATATSLTTTVNTSGLANSPIGTAGNYAVYGMSMVPSATGVASPLTGLTFTATASPAQNNNYFYGTAYLYSSNSATFSTGTATQISTVTTGAGNTLAFSGFTTAQTITPGTTKYYYVVIVYSTGVAATATQYLTYTSATTTAVVSPGTTVNGPTYTYNQVPAITAVNIPAANLSGTVVYVGQTNIAVAGIAMQINTGTTTLTQLTFSYTPAAAATLAQYFGAVRLVSTTTTPSGAYTGAGTGTALASYPATISVGAGTITVTLPAGTTINTSPTYFYLLADYSVAGGAVSRTFTFKVTGYTTGISTGTPTSTANTFTCTAPTYYWTGAAGDNNWQTGNNWEETTTAPVIVTGYYPGKVNLTYPAITTDNVDIAPVATPNSINLNASLTVAYIYFEPGRTTSLNIGTGFTLTDDYFVMGNTTSGSAASVFNLTGPGTLSCAGVNGDPALNYNATFNVNTGTFSLGNLSEMDILGNAANPAKLNLAGGTINAYDSEFYLGGNTSSITASNGTLNATNDTYLHLAAANASVVNNGANITFDATFEVNTDYASDAITNNSGTFTISGGSSGTEYGVTTVNGGTFNLTASSYDLSGGSSAFNVNGGVVNITAASTLTADYGAYTNAAGGTTNADNSTIALAVGGTSLVNSGTFNTTGGTAINYTYKQSVLSNTGGSFNATNTTINFNANNCALTNSAGSFNLNAGSVINMASSKSNITNSATGTFTCAPSSVLNLNATGVTAANAPTVTNTSALPFTLLSDATGSATIGKIAVAGTAGIGNFIGTFNVQRYISTASRNYRLLSSPVNKTGGYPATAATPNVVSISDLGQSVTSPATYNGAFIGGPGAGFPNTVANPLIYLYQESILPGSSENSSFTSGKNVGISNITSASPWTVTTVSTAAGGTTASDNSSTVKIPAGNGYILYYIHDNTSSNVTTPLTDATTTATGNINQGTIPFVLWGTGTLTTAMTLTTTAGVLYPGVTMVGNPYPSSIDLQAVYNDNKTAATNIFTSGTGEAFYELDPSTEQFVSYNYNGTTGITSGSTASRYVASGQGFYVTVVNNGNVLNFAEDQKIPSTTSAAVANIPIPVLESVRTGAGVVTDNLSLSNTKTANADLASAHAGSHTSINKITTNATLVGPEPGKRDPQSVTHHTWVKPVSPPKPDTTTVPEEPVSTLTGLHLKLVQDSLHFDECGLYFANNGSDKLDKSDSKDLDGTGGKVFLSSYTTDRVRTAINSLGGYTNGKRVPLFVKFSTSGLYKLQLEDIANFNSNYSVFLIDNLQKDSLDLTLYKSYNFNYAIGTANDSTRFVLAIEHKPIPHYALLAFAGQKVTRGVQLNWSVKNENNTTKFVLQKLTGNTYAYLDSLSSDSSGTYSYVDQHPILGNNVYRLQQTDGLGNVTYSAPVTIGYNSTTPNGDLTIYPNPTKSGITVTLNTSSMATQVATVDIYNTSGVRVEHKTVNSNSFVYDASSYKLGVYIIELKNSNGDLVGKSKFVKVQ